MDLAAALKSALEDAVQTGPQKPATRAAALKATLDENRELIVKAIGQGYSATGLAKKLKAAGVSTSVEALRRAVQAVVADSRSSAKAKPVKAPKTRATRPQEAAPVRETTPMRARATTPLRSRASDNAAFDAEERTA